MLSDDFKLVASDIYFKAKMSDYETDSDVDAITSEEEVADTSDEETTVNGERIYFDVCERRKKEDAEVCQCLGLAGVCSVG